MASESLDQFIEELGLPAKSGKIVASRGKYFLALGRTRKEIPVTVASETELARMAGKPVVAIASGRNIVAILVEGVQRPWRPRCFLCYVPVPDFFKRINPELQKFAIEKFAAEGILTGPQAKTLTQMVTQAR